MYIYIDIDTDIDIDDRWWDLSVPKDPFLRIQNSMKRNLKIKLWNQSKLMN